MSDPLTEISVALLRSFCSEDGGGFGYLGGPECLRCVQVRLSCVLGVFGRLGGYTEAWQAGRLGRLGRIEDLDVGWFVL